MNEEQTTASAGSITEAQVVEFLRRMRVGLFYQETCHISVGITGNLGAVSWSVQTNDGGHMFGDTLAECRDGIMEERRDTHAKRLKELNEARAKVRELEAKMEEAK